MAFNPTFAEVRNIVTGPMTTADVIDAFEARGAVDHGAKQYIVRALARLGEAGFLIENASAMTWSPVLPPPNDNLFPWLSHAIRQPPPAAPP